MLAFTPTHAMCSHLSQDSQQIMGRPSSPELQTQRVVSEERLLRSVEGVVRPVSAVLAGEALKALLKGSYEADVVAPVSADACAQR